MSKLGKLPVVIPAGVTVTVADCVAVQVVQGDSMLIKHHLLSGLPISLQILWYSVRMSDLSYRIKIRHCRCLRLSCI